jgi:diazepam-binding inhibitor (GABA receptor modulating acyl-CoA-binding protein)
MSVQAQFDKAVAIVKELPPDGPVKPTQDDQLLVSRMSAWRSEAVG